MRLGIYTAMTLAALCADEIARACCHNVTDRDATPRPHDASIASTATGDRKQDYDCDAAARLRAERAARKAAAYRRRYHLPNPSDQRVEEVKP